MSCLCAGDWLAEEADPSTAKPADFPASNSNPEPNPNPNPASASPAAGAQNGVTTPAASSPAPEPAPTPADAPVTDQVPQLGEAVQQAAVEEADADPAPATRESAAAGAVLEEAGKKLEAAEQEPSVEEALPAAEGLQTPATKGVQTPTAEGGQTLPLVAELLADGGQQDADAISGGKRTNPARQIKGCGISTSACVVLNAELGRRQFESTGQEWAVVNDIRHCLGRPGVTHYNAACCTTRHACRHGEAHTLLLTCPHENAEPETLHC